MHMHKKITALVVLVGVAFQSALGVPPVTDGLVAYWSLDEGTGTTIHDSIGTNDGGVNGAQWVTGIAGNALSFDGGNSVEIPDSPGLRPYNHQLSIALWINPLYQWGSPHVTIIRKGIGCAAAGWGIDCDGITRSNPIWFWGLPEDPQHISLASWCAESTDTVALGEWQFIAGTADGTMAKIYINADLSGQSAIDTSREVYNQHSITIAANYANCGYWHNHYRGAIDEVSLYNRALTDVEIRSLAMQRDLSVESIRPVQTVWNSDIDGDDRIDLVLGKETAVEVRVRTEGTFAWDEFVTVELTFGYNTPQKLDQWLRWIRCLK